MTINKINSTFFSILIILVFSISLPPVRQNCSIPLTGKAAAQSSYTSSPYKSKNAFISSVINGKKRELVGLWLPNLTGLTVENQPPGQPGYVSEAPLTATRFQLADYFGSIGLLAHAHFAGSTLQQLEPGEIVSIIYGDGSVMDYQIVEIRKYQAVDPDDEHTAFFSITSEDEQLSQEALFYEIYSQPDRLVLQTCIMQNNDNRWGRKFIISEKTQ